jgi:hypothetical protein
MLKERMTSEWAGAEVWQRHLNTREELLERQWAAINELDATSQQVLSDTKEIYVAAKARANTTLQQEEELAMLVGAVAERE